VALVELFAALLLRWAVGSAYKGHWFGNLEELRHVMRESGQSLSSEELIMINRVLDLQTLTVRQIDTPLEETLMVASITPVGEALKQAHEAGVAVLPIWEDRDGRRRILGVVDVGEVLFREDFDPAQTVGTCIRAALYLEEDMRLEVALRRMQARGESSAIVLGRNKLETGTLSMEAILKSMFGEVKL